MQFQDRQLQFSTGVLLADTAPIAEAKTAGAGSMSLASRGDHTHPRLTSAQTGTLDGAGYATIVFTRSFIAEPAVAILGVDSTSASPADFKVKQFTLDGDGSYIGCVVYGVRARALPALTAVSGIISAVITGVNAIVTALSGFVPNEPAAGVKFSIIAVQAS